MSEKIKSAVKASRVVGGKLKVSNVGACPIVGAGLNAEADLGFKKGSNVGAGPNVGKGLNDETDSGFIKVSNGGAVQNVGKGPNVGTDFLLSEEEELGSQISGEGWVSGAKTSLGARDVSAFMDQDENFLKAPTEKLQTALPKSKKPKKKKSKKTGGLKDLDSLFGEIETFPSFTGEDDELEEG